MAEKEQPIIIKKIKKGGHGHHGGAWKVAYADFVTAMMAFFLLLWLLSTTSDEQKEGIAEYFTPTIGLKDAKGIGFQGGKSSAVEGNSRSDKTAEGLVIGQTPQGPVANEPNVKPENASPENQDQAAPQGAAEEGEQTKQPSDSSEQSKNEDEKSAKEDGEKGNADQELFDEAAKEVQKTFADDEELKKFKDNIIVTNTPEGLKIDIIDDMGQPMFAPGSSTMTTTGKKVLEKMGQIIAKTPNQLAVAGHTDSTPLNGPDGYSNWDLSSDRANASRRFMQNSTALGNDRVTKITGMADRDLLMPSEPNSPRNRRISITLLRGKYVSEKGDVNPAAKSLVTVPDADPNMINPPAPEPPAQPEPVSEPEPEAKAPPEPKELRPAPPLPSNVAPGLLMPVLP